MKANGSFHWKCLLKQMLSLTTVFAIVLADAPATAFAQAKGKSPKVAAVSAPTTTVHAKETPTPGGGQREGIKVHGHWTIEVLNPDGSLVKRYEFDNALEPTGKTTLASLLSRNSSPGFWIVMLHNSSCVAGTCAGLVEAGDPLWVNKGGPAVGVFGLNPPSLALVNPNNFLAGVAIVLEGRATVWHPIMTQIESVSTLLQQCPSDVSAAQAISSPQLCNSSGASIIPIVPFTKHVLAAPISNLVLGQILTIKVAFTFS